MNRKNCWEVMACGREMNGMNVTNHGVCPASTEERLNGINGGFNAGRACWAVKGTNCSGKPQKQLAEMEQVIKLTECLQCLFFKQVEDEEGRHFVVMGEILERLK